MGLQRTNVMLDSELWKRAQSAGKDIERSGSWILNKALEAYLQKKKTRKQTNKPAVVENALMFMPLNSGEHGVTADDIEKYKSLYPAVNIDQELRAMIGWLDANPSRRKTKTGIAKFINSWLARAQDKGGSRMTVASSLTKVGQRTMQNLEGEW